MPTATIIGASRGIGLGLVTRYASEGWRVHATTRTPDEPGAPEEVEGDVIVHGLEVTDDTQIRALRKALAPEAIDVLIHNAGVYGDGMTSDEVNRINARAPIKVAEALLDLVARSAHRKIALVTSQMGSRRSLGNDLGKYGESKAALNDRFRALEPRWRSLGVLAVVLHPGWVRTDMGGPNASISVAESAEGIYRVMAALTDDDHGRFWTWDGRELPW